MRTLRVLVGDRVDVGSGAAVADVPRSDVVRWPGRGEDDRLPSVDWLQVVGQSTAWLRRFVSGAAAASAAGRVTVVVESWRTPQPGWAGRVGPLPGLVRHEVRLPTSATGRAVVDLTLQRPLPVSSIVAAALEGLTPQHPLPRTSSPEVAVDGALPAWLDVGTERRAAARGWPEEEFLQPYDVVLTHDTGCAHPPPAATVLRVEQYGARSQRRGGALLLDALGCHPVPPPRDGDAREVFDLRFDPDELGPYWRVAPADGKDVVAEGGPQLLPLEEQGEAWRPVGVLRYESGTGGDPAREAAVVAQLAATGAPLSARRLAAPVAAHLCDELRTALVSPLPDALGDPVEWEVRRVRLRRAALRGHATAFHLGRVAGLTRRSWRLPSVSVLLVSARPDRVPDAVAAMAAQTYPELEIVLGLHGCHLDRDARRRVAAAHGRPVEIVHIPRAATLGEALGAVTAHARGELVTKVDDDDGYGPDHIWDLVVARASSGATVAGKGSELVYLEQLDLTVRRSMASETYSTVVAGGAMLLARGDLAAVGGWRPVPRGVDRSLLDRVTCDGGLIYRAHPFGFLHCRHPQGHTWEPGLEYFLRGSGTQWRGRPPFLELAAGG